MLSDVSRGRDVPVGLFSNVEIIIGSGKIMKNRHKSVPKSLRPPRISHEVTRN